MRCRWRRCIPLTLPISHPCPACRNCEAELNRLRVDLRTALESLLQHRMHVAARLQQTAAGVRNVAAQLQAVPLPEGLSGAEGGAGASQSGPVPMQM